MVCNRGHAAPGHVDLLQVGQVERKEDVGPERRQVVVSEVEHLGVAVHARDGRERGVDTLYSLLSALPHTGARLGAVGHGRHGLQHAHHEHHELKHWRGRDDVHLADRIHHSFYFGL
jgi:hypothetical protein